MVIKKRRPADLTKRNETAVERRLTKLLKRIDKRVYRLEVLAVANARKRIF